MMLNVTSPRISRPWESAHETHLFRSALKPVPFIQLPHSIPAAREGGREGGTQTLDHIVRNQQLEMSVIIDAYIGV